jgi:hypothetical protein
MFTDTRTPSAFRPVSDATMFRPSIARDVEPKTWSDFVALARATAAGQGVAHPLFTRTDEQLAQALLQIETRCNPAAKLAQMDAFYTANGVRRGDDKRVSA